MRCTHTHRDCGRDCERDRRGTSKWVIGMIRDEPVTHVILSSNCYYRVHVPNH